jgi:drug/metabolite transporter (DMT)-like permease
VTQNDKQLTASFSGAAFLMGNILCWAAVPVLLRYLTHAMDAWTANGVRYPLAAVFFVPILISAWRSGELTGRMLARCIVPALLGCGGQILWGLSPYYLPAGTIGFLLRASLLFSLAGAMFLFPDERRLLRHGAFYIGLILSIVGFVVLSLSKMQTDREVTLAGILIAAGCSLFYGLYGVSVRYYLQGMNPLISSGAVSVFVSIGMAVLMLFVGEYAVLVDVSLGDWGLIVLSSITGITLGHYFLYAAVPRLGAAVTSAAQTLTPFATLVLAVWFLGESLTRLEWSAGLMMVAGAAILLWAQYRLVTAIQK